MRGWTLARRGVRAVAPVTHRPEHGRKINPGLPETPVVRVIGDRSGVRETATLVDLAAPENSKLKIKRFLNPQTYNIDLKYFVLKDLPLD